MKVQNRLSLYSTIVFSVIFAVISIIIYSAYFHNTEKAIQGNLKKTVYLTAIFYLEEDELNSQEFAKVKDQFNKNVNNSHYQFYDEQDSISYGSSYQKVSHDILQDIREKGSLAFSDNEFICYGIFYEDNQGDFVVISREKKEIITQQMELLLWILLVAYLIGTLAIILLNKWIAHIAYHPFRDVIKQVNNISTNNLDIRIESPNTQDELQNLIETFNDLLAKISETFVIQKNFVSYVSHEFKTPLAAIQGNLEVFSIKDRSPEEYKSLSEKLIQQISQMEEILNTLIIISDLRNNSDITTQIRIDELVWEIVSKISKLYTKANISVKMDILPQDMHILLVTKDRTQILIALYNLIENGVKFSREKMVSIDILKQDGKLCLLIKDQGIGIPPEKIANISKPFYRAGNANQILGSGIGLSIALRILEKNDIKYTIASEVNKGTAIQIIF